MARKRFIQMLLAAALLLAGAWPLRAQFGAQHDTLGVQGFLHGWSVSASGGVNWFYHLNGSGFQGNPGVDYELTVGKRFSAYSGVRLGYEGGGMSYKRLIKSLGYGYIHGDVLWDASNTFLGVSATRVWAVMPYMHFGLLGLMEDKKIIEREYASGLGLLTSFRMFPSLSFTMDARTAFYTTPVGRGAGHLGNLSFLAGLRWEPDGLIRWRRIKPGTLIENSFGSNWFVNVTGGVNTIGDLENYRGGWAPALDVGFGKWLTPEFGLRLGWQGLRFTNRGTQPREGVTTEPDGDLMLEKFRFGYVHGDVMWNVIPYKYGNRWTVGPYMHMGFITERSLDGHPFGRWYAGGGGVFASYRFTRRLGVQAELKAIMLNGGTAGDTGSGGLVFAGSGLLGLNLQLGPTEWKNWTPVNRVARNEFGEEESWDEWWDQQEAIERERRREQLTGIWKKKDKAEKTEKVKTEKTKTEKAEKPKKEKTEKVVPEKVVPEKVVKEKVVKEKVERPKVDWEAFFAQFALPADRHDLKKSGAPYRIGKFEDNWSVQLQAGSTEGALAADLTLAKWITPQVGARVGYQGLSLAGTQGSAGYAYLHTDIITNVADMFGEYNPSRRYKIAPYLHFGLIAEYDNRTIPMQMGNFEYVGGAGLLGSFALDRHLSVTAEYRGTMVTGDVSLSNVMRFTSTVMLGLEYNFGTHGWRPLNSSATDGVRLGRFLDNWFISGAAGVNRLTDIRGSSSLSGLGLDLTLGKWITPHFGLRGGFQGIRAARMGSDPHKGVWAVEQPDGQFREEFGFGYLHGDLLWNVGNTVLPYKQDRIWSFVPYLHMGALMEKGVEEARNEGFFERELAAGVGLLNSFRLNQDVDLFLDMRAAFLRAQASGDDKSRMGLLPSVLFGLSGRLGPQGFARDEAQQEGSIHLRDSFQPDWAVGISASDRSRWALSLNLGDLALLGTLGLSAQWAPLRHWSVEGMVRLNTLSFKNDSLYDMRQSFALGARWWPWHVYSGLFVRGAAQVETMNRHGLPLIPDFAGESYGLTVGAGYSLMLTRHLNAELGVGVFGGRRHSHDNPGKFYWFGSPDTLLLSLVWVL